MGNEWIKRNKWIFFVAPLGIAVFIAIFGEVVMHLWNWLLPPLFGLHQVTFWQALGLLILCRILFGGFGGHGNDRRNKIRRKMDDRWEQLTPEEREKLRQSWRGRCGGFEAPADESKEPA
jgi:hypothetical protein